MLDGFVSSSLATMISIFTLILAFLVVCVSPRPQGGLSTVVVREMKGGHHNNCSSVCKTLNKECKHQGISCICSTGYFQTFGDCELCHSPKSRSKAKAQLFIDRMMMLCNDHGFPVNFKLQLPPDAQEVVDNVHRQNSQLRQYQTTFLALQIAGGQIGLVILLVLPIFLRKLRRDPTFFNFCLTWIISSVAYSIVLYHHSEGNTLATPLRHIPPLTCLTQAALINGVQVMTACSTMALVIQLWITLRTAIYGDQLYALRHKHRKTFLLLVPPYLLFFTFAIPTFVIGKGHITLKHFNVSVQRVLPTTFYCSIVNLNFFLRTIYGVTFLLLVVTVVFDVLIIIILYRHWRTFRVAKTKSGVPLSVLLRVLVFSMYRVVVAVTYATVLDRPPEPNVNTLFIFGNSIDDSATSGVPIWVDLLQAAIPLVGFVVFGANADMFRGLMFWRKSDESWDDEDSGYERPLVSRPSVTSLKT